MIGNDDVCSSFSSFFWYFQWKKIKFFHPEFICLRNVFIKIEKHFCFLFQNAKSKLSLRLYAFYFSLVDDNEFDETLLE